MPINDIFSLLIWYLYICMFICFITSLGIVLTLPSDIPIYLSVFSMHPHPYYQCHFSDWYFGRPLLGLSFILYNPLLYCLPTFILSLIITHNCTYILWSSLKISLLNRRNMCDPHFDVKKKKVTIFSSSFFLLYLRKKSKCLQIPDPLYTFKFIVCSCET